MSKTSRDKKKKESILKDAMYRFSLEDLEQLKSGINVAEFESLISPEYAKELIEKLDLEIAEREHVEEPE